MATPLDQPIVCPLFVARTAYLDALARALDRGAGGSGQALLISGEAGIGKSRLIGEARSLATGRGQLALQGACFEPDRSLPFAPLIDLLRDLLAVRTAHEVATLLGDEASHIVPLLPALAPWLQTPPSDTSTAPQHGKRLLFDSLSRLLAQLAAEQPLLLVVEDLHWADDVSLEFLGYLARRIPREPIVLTLSYRDEQANPGLARLLTELNRARLAVELRLERLGVTHVDAMLRALLSLDRSMPADLLHTVFSLTEGNPFFVEEVARSLAPLAAAEEGSAGWHAAPRSGVAVPRSVRDAVRTRLDQLSPAARRALDLAAVAGRRFDFNLLRELLDCDDADVLSRIKELVAAQLVVEESVDRFAFRHALTRQAVYSEMLARERRDLHRAIAETLERLAAGSVAAELEDLAYHFSAACIWDRALGYAQRAGERALAMHAPRAAVEQLTRALDAAHQLGLAPSLQLLRQRGLAFEVLGEFDHARLDHEAALAAARVEGEQRAEWRALLDLGLLWSARSYERAGTYVRQALDVARALDDPALLAHSLNRLGNWHVNLDEISAARDAHGEALAIFEALGDRAGIAETLDLLGLTSLRSADLARGTIELTRAAELYRELDNRIGLVSVLSLLTPTRSSHYTDTMVPAPLQFADTIGCGEEALRIARAIGWQSGEAYALLGLSSCWGTQGDYVRALELAETGLAIARAIEHAEWTAALHSVLGLLYLDLLAFDDACHHLEVARALAQENGSRIWVVFASYPLASARLARGELERADALLDSVVGPDMTLLTEASRPAWCVRAEVALARGDAAKALEIVERLVAATPNLDTTTVVPRLWKLRGEALAALGRVEEAASVLRAARHTAQTDGTRPLLWRLHATLGRLERSRGRHDDAEADLVAARTLVLDLAAPLPEPLRETFVRGANALIPPLRSRSPRRVSRDVVGGLTERECEVAALVAQGRSNRAIAENLVLGQRTIESHVASIMAKLGYVSRAQIAAWAVEHGLRTSTKD